MKRQIRPKVQPLTSAQIRLMKRRVRAWQKQMRPFYRAIERSVTIPAEDWRIIVK